jgi:predicted nucleic acid-binding protein
MGAQTSGTIENFLTRNGFIRLPVTTIASRQAVQLLKQYSLSQGLSIPDALIAGVVLESKASLVTGNIRHFQFITDLMTQKPPYRRD